VRAGTHSRSPSSPAGGDEEGVRDAFVERERRSLYNSLPSQQRDRYSHGLSRASIGESRSRDEYIEEVETYAAELKTRWAELVAIHHVEHERSELVAIVVNDTAENYEDVVLELTLPVALDCVYTRPHEAANRLDPRERPAAYGRGLLASITPHMPIIPGLRSPEPELEEPEAGSTLSASRRCTSARTRPTGCSGSS
jgi:hypothetical protein